MKSKKVFMIVVLIVFIGIIVVVLANINSSSVGKNNDKSINKTNTTNSNSSSANSSNTQSSGRVKKSNEKANADTNNMIEITDNFFIEQTNDVYFNLDDYVGKTIKLEGLIYTYKTSKGEICYAVVRNTPGCCGNDGLAGLDIRYDEEYPAENTWVEVIGVVKSEKIDGTEIPAIQVSSMTIKETGKTFVTN